MPKLKRQTEARAARVRRNRERNAVPAPERMPTSGVHRITTAGTMSIKRSFTVSASLVAATTAPYGSVVYATLSSLPSYTDFTALFDQYKFDMIKVTFYRPYQQTGTMDIAANASQSVLPQLLLHTAVDFDDAVAPVTPPDLQQYPSYQCTILTGSADRFSVTFKPRVALAAYSGAFTSYANMDAWLDSASPNVQTYGLKFLLEPRFADGSSATFGFKLTLVSMLEVWMSFRNPR